MRDQPRHLQLDASMIAVAGSGFRRGAGLVAALLLAVFLIGGANPGRAQEVSI